MAHGPRNTTVARFQGLSSFFFPFQGMCVHAYLCMYVWTTHKAVLGKVGTLTPVAELVWPV